MHQAELETRCQDGLAVIAKRYIPDRAEIEAAAASPGLGMLPTTFVINWEALAADLVIKLLRNVGDLLIELGRERRADIERAADRAIIALVTWDIPGLPESVERKLDAHLQQSATKAVNALLDSVLGPKP